MVLCLAFPHADVPGWCAQPFWPWVLDTVELHGVVVDGALVLLACNLALCMLLIFNAATRTLLVCDAKQFCSASVGQAVTGHHDLVQHQLSFAPIGR